tara:strand:+ start:18 stop:467 length:450 start_codon:yes stop_codon:yes gene_type:complete
MEFIDVGITDTFQTVVLVAVAVWTIMAQVNNLEHITFAEFRDRNFIQEFLDLRFNVFQVLRCRYNHLVQTGTYFKLGKNIIGCVGIVLSTRAFYAFTMSHNVMSALFHAFRVLSGLGLVISIAEFICEYFVIDVVPFVVHSLTRLVDMA